jgi:hypothetical protein
MFPMRHMKNSFVWARDKLRQVYRPGFPEVTFSVIGKPPLRIRHPQAVDRRSANLDPYLAFIPCLLIA